MSTVRDGAIEAMVQASLAHVPGWDEALANDMLDALLDYLEANHEQALSELPEKAENVGKALALHRMSDFVVLLRGTDE